MIPALDSSQPVQLLRREKTEEQELALVEKASLHNDPLLQSFQDEGILDRDYQSTVDFPMNTS